MFGARVIYTELLGVKIYLWVSFMVRKKKSGRINSIQAIDSYNTFMNG